MPVLVANNDMRASCGERAVRVVDVVHVRQLA